jgi:phosphate starvation-inducible PhoH-like protein
MANKRKKADRDETIREQIEQQEQEQARQKAELDNSHSSHRRRSNTIQAKSPNQQIYIDSIRQNHVTICSGPAGSGKTAIAVGLACEMLQSKKIERIIITRPTIDTGKDLGSLPGTFTEKIHPYLVPILDEMGSYYTDQVLEMMIKKNIINICPLQYMRGRNFHNSVMILDESQNATFMQLKMFITRMGFDSKIIMNGDVEQSDLPDYIAGGFQKCIDRLQKLDGVGVCFLEGSDIVRHSLLGKMLARLKD